MKKKEDIFEIRNSNGWEKDKIESNPDNLFLSACLI